MDQFNLIQSTSKSGHTSPFLPSEGVGLAHFNLSFFANNHCESHFYTLGGSFSNTPFLNIFASD